MTDPANLNVELLPYNQDLIAFLHQQKLAGRSIILVTSAGRAVAEAVARHLKLFDDIICCDVETKPKGLTKSSELVRRFGHGGFDYIGNSRADLPVWREAHGIGMVNASRALSAKVRKLGPVIAEFDSRPSVLLTALRAMRPHQWVKNLLVFVPLLASRSFGDTYVLLGALTIFASFCATASGIYLINDLLDLNADRRHPRKRHRPLANGTLQLGFGTGLAAVLVACGITLASVVDAAYLVAGYAALCTLYSLRLKQYPLLDVFVLAAFYTLRIVAGGVASDHRASLWLLAFSGFAFLSLALVKRIGELGRLDKSDRQIHLSRRGYSSEDRQLLLMFGVASAFASSIVLALFVNSEAAFQGYKSPEVLWSLVPLILFWQCRLWLSAERGNMHDDPIVHAFRDWVSWLVGGCVLGLMIYATWAAPG